MRFRPALVVLLAALAVPASAAANGQTIAAGFDTPYEAVRDTTGGILVADRGANVIKRIAPNGSVSIVAGTGVAGFSGDGGPAAAAKLNAPTDVAPTPGGGFVIADGANGRVRRVTPDGTISTALGGGLFAWKCAGPMLGVGAVTSVTANRDGGFVALTTGGIYSVAPDGTTRWLGATRGNDIERAADGSLLVARGNVVDRVPAAGGTAARVAGRGEAGNSGDGGPAVDALYDGVAGLAPTADGSLYVADSLNSRIRLVTPDGTARPFADGIAFRAPYGVTSVAAGELVVADTYNHAVRRITDPGLAAPVVPPAATSAGTNEACRGLDTTFGAERGLTRLPVAASSHQHLSPPASVVTEPGGVFTIAGRGNRGEEVGLQLERVGATGRRDAAFAANAFVAFPNAATTLPRGIAKLPDGRYLAIAAVFDASDIDLVLVAFGSDGQVDRSFGANGRVTVLENTDGASGGVVVPGPGSAITVAALAKNSVLTLIRRDAAGRPVAGFGTNGVVSVSDLYTAGQPATGYFDAAGRLVLGAGAQVMRFRPDGTRDPAWGERGVAALGEPQGAALGLAPLPDGRLVVAGRTANGPLLVRFDPAGRIDPAFQPRLPPLTGDLRDVVARPDGRLLLAGVARDDAVGVGAALVGLLADGAPDPSVGTNGRLVTPMADGSMYTRIARLPDGSVAAAGFLYSSDGYVVTRYGPLGGADAAVVPSAPVADRGGTSDGAEVPPAAVESSRVASPAVAAGVLTTHVDRRAAVTLAAPAKVTGRNLRRRGIAVTVTAAKAGLLVLRLGDHRGTVARTAVRVRPGRRVLVLRPTRRMRGKRLTIRATLDGRPVAERAVALR